LLARLPIKTYWTTNYDRLIEKALETVGRRADAKYTLEQLAITKPGRDAVVYKMHGDIEHPDKAVLSKDDYEGYSGTHSAFITALSGDLVEKTFLFLGFSFTDPNLDFILSRVRTQFTRNQRQHYCVMKRRARYDAEAEEDFNYAVTRQDLFIEDLRRFNIQTIVVDEFSQITVILKTLERRYRRRTVFISGSAEEFDPWNRSTIEELLINFARGLVKRDMRIASGLGLGIGVAVVSGAVQQIYSGREREIEKHLLLRPFQIELTDPQERRDMFARYREEMISQAGIAVFFMGNKIVDGRVVNAEGVRAEFKLAKAHDLFVIPVGCFGWVASELWSEVMDNFDDYFQNSHEQFRAPMAILGTAPTVPSDLLDPLLQLVDKMSNE
jgi:hypothetical protein